MKNILLLILSLTIADSLGQLKNNRHDELTKYEYKELTTHKDEFIPSDINERKVIIIRYSPERLVKFQHTARLTSFAIHGIDTTKLTEDSLMTQKDIENNLKRLKKTSVEYPEELRKAFEKYGIKSIIKDEGDLTSISTEEYRYLLETRYVSTMKHPTEISWVMTMTSYFHDRIRDRDYEKYLPLNHNLLDWLR